MNWIMSVTACAYACAALGLDMSDLCEPRCAYVLVPIARLCARTTLMIDLARLRQP